MRDGSPGLWLFRANLLEIPKLVLQGSDSSPSTLLPCDKSGKVVEDDDVDDVRHSWHCRSIEMGSSSARSVSGLLFFGLPLRPRPCSFPTRLATCSFLITFSTSSTPSSVFCLILTSLSPPRSKKERTRGNRAQTNRTRRNSTATAGLIATIRLWYILP